VNLSIRQQIDPEYPGEIMTSKNSSKSKIKTFQTPRPKKILLPSKDSKHAPDSS